MARLRVYLVIAVVVIVVGVGFWLWLRPNPVSVKYVVLKRADMVVSVFPTTTSTIRSDNEITISAQRNGRITHLPVEEGDLVTRGQVVVRLDLSEETARIFAERDQARATLTEAERTYARLQDLFAKGYVSQQEVDSAKKGRDAAKALVTGLDEAAAQYEKYSVLRAPFDGVISIRPVQTGELVTVGKPIVTIVDPARLYISSTIDEVDVGRLSLSQPVKVTIDAFPGKTFEAVVERISPVVTGGKLETRTFETRNRFRPPAPPVKPGMSADVEILTEKVAGAISVPTPAVVDRKGEKIVYRLIGGRAVATPVRIGLSNWNVTVVESGLAEGEQVILTPDVSGMGDGVRAAGTAVEG